MSESNLLSFLSGTKPLYPEKKKEVMQTLKNQAPVLQSIDPVLVQEARDKNLLKDLSPDKQITLASGENKEIVDAMKRKVQSEQIALEKVVAKKKLGKLGKKEGSKVDWAGAGQKVAAGLISAAQEREKARIAQDTINRGLLRDQLELSNAASARKGQALSGLRTALANYFR